MERASKNLASSLNFTFPFWSIQNTSNESYTTNSQIYNNNNINDDSINALGPDLAIATSQVLESLSDHERQIIMDVLSRDENVRQRDAARIM